MVIPAQRLSDLESAAWQADKRLERIESDLFELKTAVGKLQEMADQHGVALAATMQDLRDFRIDVGQTLGRHTAMLEKHDTKLDEHSAILGRHTALLEKHDAMLEKQGAMLEAIVKHFGIELPPPESPAA